MVASSIDSQKESVVVRVTDIASCLTPWAKLVSGVLAPAVSGLVWRKRLSDMGAVLPMNNLGLCPWLP